MFEYYKEKPSKGESPKGQINLEDCRAVNSGLNHNKHKFVFSIELKDRTYYLVAGSQGEMTSWVTTLCSYCGFCTPARGEELSALHTHRGLCCGCFVFTFGCTSVIYTYWPFNGLPTKCNFTIFMFHFM